MRLLWLKAWRDFVANRSAFAACILMMGLAIALLVGFSSAYLNLGYSADLTYRKLLFEDVFVELQGSPNVVPRLQSQPEVLAVEGRRTESVRVLLPNGEETSGLLVGIPADRELTVNRLFINEGSGLGNRRGEVLLERRYAVLHGYKVGDTLRIERGEDQRRFRIVGLVSSPEYLWLTPDRLDPRPAARRFAVMFVSHADVASVAGNNLINEVHIRLRPGYDLANSRSSIEGALLAERNSPARGRSEQPSYSLLERDRRAFAGVAAVFPLTLMALSGLMLFLTLWQLLHSQRKQIGILLCQGLSHAWVVVQYVSLALLVGAASSLVGCVLGPVLSYTASGYYVDILGLPYHTSGVQISSLVLGWVAALLIALVSSGAALRNLLRAQPLALLRSEFLPQAGLPSLLGWLPLRFSYRTLFPLRNLLRQPWRSLTMVAGVTLANALLLMTLALIDSHTSTLEFYLDQAHRYDMQVRMFPTEQSSLPPVELWPGVQRVEPVLRVSGTVHAHGVQLERGMWGLPSDTRLLRSFDLQGHEVKPKAGGGILMASLQQKQLRVHAGSPVKFQIHSWFHKPQMFRETVGPTLYEPIQGPPKMELSELQKLTQQAGHLPALVNTLLIKVRPETLPDVRHRLLDDKRVEDVVTMSDIQADIRDMLRLAMAYLSLMLACAGLIALALVHACTTMNLSERKGEVACMLVQGIRQSDLFRLLLLEALYLWVLGLVLGVPAGYLGGDWLLGHYQPELIDLRLELRHSTVVMTALSSLVVTLLASTGAIRRLVRIPLAEATRSPD